MYDRLLSWTLTLTVETPLHLGSGDEILTRSLPGQPLVDDNRGENDKKGEVRRVATVQRGSNSLPYIPGSSFKGALRALDGTATDATGACLWGEIKSQTGGGQMGLATFYGAEADAASLGKDYPVELTIKDRPLSVVVPHVAIDAATGTADDHKLYFREMTPVDVTFALRVVVRLAGAEPEEQQGDAIERLRTLLGVIERDGLRLGSGSADADGRMKVAVAVTDNKVWANGAWRDLPEADIAPIKARPGDAHAWALRLTCPGPFLIMDGLDRKAAKGADDRSGTVHIKAVDIPQVDTAGRPWAPGSSLTGALRRRLAWLASVKAMAKGAASEAIAQEDGLRAAEALFGSEKQRARLRLVRVAAKNGKPKTMTSVSLDRFTSGPLEGALFTSQTYVGVNLEADFVLDPPTKAQREPEKKENQIDQTRLAGWLDLLKQDVADNGLQLGSGAAKGFGWFEPVKAEAKNG